MTSPDLYLSAALGSGQTPNPWFTVANQFLPRNLHDVIRWARYITIQSPVTTEVIRKLATFPITEFLVETKNESTKKKYKEVFSSFKLKQNLQDVGFDYYTIGNVFMSVYFPIHRMLTCPSCQTSYNAKKADFVKFHQYQFKGICPGCSYDGAFIRKDSRSLNVQDMNLIKWNPEHIAVNHNPITGESEYYYKIPNQIRNKIKQGDKLYINSVPWAFIEAVRYNQDFKFDNDSIFHLRNVSTGAIVEGVSVPPLITLFGLVFYQATLRKANESIAGEHLAPLRVVFPQPQSGNIDIGNGLNMKSFSSHMQDAIKKHKKDLNHFLVSPVAVGYQQIGGDGKNLLVAQEIQQAEESILLSLGVSRELLTGTTNWTSSTVGLRMLENTMRSYTSQLQELINWIMGKVASYINIEICNVTMTPFKLTDDDNLKTILFQAAQNDQGSWSHFYETFGMSYDEILDKQKEDKVAKAENDLKIKFEIEQAEFLASKDIGKKMDDSGGYQNLLREAQQYVTQIVNAGPDVKMQVLMELKVENYPLYLMTTKLLDEYNNGMMPQDAGQQEDQDPNQPSEENQGQPETTEEEQPQPPSKSGKK